MGRFFYNLGRTVGPKLRKAQWMWASFAGTEAQALALERAVGVDLASEARLQLPPDPDPRTQATLDAVGRSLCACVANRRCSFEFHAFLAGEPNAFALPGGFIFAARALLELCHWDRSEIAFVLGHEMGHVIRRHAIERIVAASAVSLASRAAPVRGVLGTWLRTVGIPFLQTAYSRDQELEADRLGLRLAAAAGFEPQAALRLLARLGDLKKSADPSLLGDYFSTHPTSDVRLQTLRPLLPPAVDGKSEA